MISSQSTLHELQQYVEKTEHERGFSKQSSVEKCLLLGEEIGELFRAVRRASGLAVDSTSKVADVGEELADVLNYVFAIANRHDIDLANAFLAKEVVNRGREWH